MIAAGGMSSIPPSRILVQAPNQMHIIGVGIFAGFFGALWLKPLKSLLWPNYRLGDVPAPRGRHYGLSLLAATVTGMLMPRFALAMDATRFWLWDLTSSLSNYNE